MSFRNLSRLDRTIRLGAGLLMLWASWAAAAPDAALWPVALRVFAGFPLITSLLGWCPVYAILGLSTGKPKPPHRDR